LRIYLFPGAIGKPPQGRGWVTLYVTVPDPAAAEPADIEPLERRTAMPVFETSTGFTLA
jgi:hypothetical protein